MKITISTDDGVVITVLDDVENNLKSPIGEAGLFNDVKEGIERGVRFLEREKEQQKWKMNL